MCVGGEDLLTIRSSSPDSSEHNVTRVISVIDPSVTISYVVDSSVGPNINLCNNNYSFEIAAAVNTVTRNQWVSSSLEVNMSVLLYIML